MLAIILAGFTACKQNTTDSEKPVAQKPVLPTAPTSGPELGGAPNQAAGIAWTIPAGWEIGPARQMRVATYRIHAVAGDPEDAECAAYFFGPGQGGSVEANLDRWAHQFTAANGQPLAQAPKVEKRQVAGFNVATMSVSGTYLGGGGMMSQQEINKPNFRMLAAIVEAPQGLVFFKFTGPLNTVSAAEADFNGLIASIHAQ